MPHNCYDESRSCESSQIRVKYPWSFEILMIDYEKESSESMARWLIGFCPVMTGVKESGISR